MRLSVWMAAALVSVCTGAVAQKGMSGEGQWLYYGGDQGNTKYSALDQINKDNIGQLKVVWEWTSPDDALAAGNRALTPFLNEQTPIVVDGVMYVTTSFAQAAAIDPVSGENLWTFDSESYKAGRPTNLGFVHRGPTFWKDGDDKRIFFATHDMKLWSLDAETGKPDPEFADGTAIDLAGTMRRPVNKKMMQVTSPLAQCRGVIVVGSSIFDGPTMKEMPPGDVRGYDAKTGKLLWTFHNPPLEGEFGHDTWKDGAAEYTGNGNVWTVMSADEELGYVYLPFGTPTNDWYGGHRKGNGLFAESLVCVDARTGKRVWHFQTTHHGLWDYDLPTAPALFDTTIDGKPRKILVQATKQGFLFVLDRVTGEPIWPIEEKAVPQSTAEGEETWPTQPHPTKPVAYELQGSFEKDLIDFTPELHAKGLAIFNTYNTGPLFTPPMEAKPTMYNPGWAGGANWMGVGVDLETGLVYVPSQQGPISIQLQRPDPARSNFTYMGKNDPVNGPDGLPLFKPPYGRITAYDMKTGDIAWMQPIGDGPIDNPALKDVDMAAYLKKAGLPRLGDPSRFHPLVTKNLLFVAQGSMGRSARGGPGGAKPNFMALDKATGDVVWKTTLPAGPTGTPMTYSAGGKQFITVATGGVGQPSKLYTLALP